VVLAHIIGAQYTDVAKALNGTQQFKMAAADAVYQPVASVMPSTTPSTSAAISNSPSTSASAFSVVAGQKRKNTPEVHGDVVDLTGESL